MSDLNDPRVFLAAERTALAWSRTAITLIALGFAIERFGSPQESIGNHDTLIPFLFGIIFILFGCGFSFIAAVQYKNTLKTLKPIEIPQHINTQMAFILNLMIAAMSLLIICYLLVTNFL